MLLFCIMQLNIIFVLINVVQCQISPIDIITVYGCIHLQYVYSPQCNCACIFEFTSRWRATVGVSVLCHD